MAEHPQDEQGDEHWHLRGRLEGAIKDVLKRTLTQGIGAKQVTEDAIRGAIGDFKMPKEVATYIVSQADTIKNDIVRVTANEIRTFLESANIGEEISKILTSLSFEVRTEIRFIPNDEAVKANGGPSSEKANGKASTKNSVKPNVKSRVRVKNARSGEEIGASSDLRDLDNMIRSSVSHIADRLMFRRRDEEADLDEDTDEVDDSEADDDILPEPAPKRKRSTTRAKSTAAKSTTAKSTAAKSTAAKPTAAKSTRAKSTPAKSTAKGSTTRSRATKASGSKSRAKSTSTRASKPKTATKSTAAQSTSTTSKRSTRKAADADD